MTASPKSPLSVLLVEDNPNDATLIEKHLRAADTVFLPDEVQFTHVTELDEGIALLDEEDIDLLLLDLGLPRTTGIETFERVEDRTEEVPVIVLTGLQDEQAAVSLLQQGAQDYLNKGSLDRDRLVKSIRYALERQDREAELKQTTEQLEVLNRILRHDLRNDIQVLKTWLETLAARGDDEQRDALSKSLTTLEHMEELTDNSKEFMQLVAGDDITLEPVRADEFLRTEVERVRSAYPDAEFVVEEDMPTVTVIANEMLSSAFRNLLNNAVQHCNEEVPRVEVSIDLHESSVVMTVADNGPGVPDDRKSEIFGKGQQGTESSGTGIGLYLVHTLVTKFGGRVWVADRDECESGDGTDGSVFCIKLDVHEA